MQFQFYLTYAQQAGATFGPFEGPVLIGRGEDTVLKLDDRWVSRRHCEIAPIDGRLVVRDLDSTHGTLLNREHVREAELSPGDEITIGLNNFVVHWEASRSGKVVEKNRLAVLDA